MEYITVSYDCSYTYTMDIVSFGSVHYLHSIVCLYSTNEYIYSKDVHEHELLLYHTVCSIVNHCLYRQ